MIDQLYRIASESASEPSSRIYHECNCFSRIVIIFHRKRLIHRTVNMPESVKMSPYDDIAECKRTVTYMLLTKSIEKRYFLCAKSPKNGSFVS